MKTLPVAFTLALLSLVVAGAAVSRATPQGAGRVAPCPNPLPHEPLVVYEVSGGTFAGTVDGFLTVTTDGVARYSSSLGSGPGFALTAYVGDAAAAGLHAGLISAGALRQCDQDVVWNDVPLSTLTVLRGTTPQSGVTFSWWVAEGDVVRIEALLSAFIVAHFPVPPPSGGS